MQVVQGDDATRVNVNEMSNIFPVATHGCCWYIYKPQIRLVRGRQQVSDHRVPEISDPFHPFLYPPVVTMHTTSQSVCGLDFGRPRHRPP
jgi:hypothetical protein